MSDFEAPVDQFPKAGSSASGTHKAFSIEARYAFHTPKKFGDLLLDTRWRRVNYTDVPDGFGVPKGTRHLFAADQCGLLGYAAAQALRWWFHANADHYLGFSACLETRIVVHEVKYSFNESAIDAGSLIQGREQFMPADSTAQRGTEHGR